MNKIKCEIFKQVSQDGMSFIQLDCGSERLGVMSLDEGWKAGEIVWANFKESDVMIALDSRISARNKFYSPILSIVHNSILARVVFAFQSYQISSLISYEATKELGLKEGMECFWFVKSNEILLLRG